ncbi:MAG: MoaD/ThiS family protein [Solirubrobacterales bacterium]|jgi:molybdopterin synthase sulfur carrier subunit|nr:MoaD/ThiS family protein [Solirubrobacterales bacterium]
MAVKVKLPTQLRAVAGGDSEVLVEAATVGQALAALYAVHPDLKDRIADDDGTLRRFVNVYVNGDDIRFGEGLDTPLAAGAELQILPAVAGG